MILGLYAVRDAATQALSMVSAYGNDRTAVRSFGFMAKHGASQLEIVKDNPGDFNLYCLGTFDDISGELRTDLRLVSSFIDIIQEANHVEQPF